jgi:tetratricopeptide (TPR) repeat protein
MALAWSGLTVTQDDLVSQVYTPGKEGSLQADILAAARRNGRLAIQVGDLSDVLAEIAAGHPVLVFQNLALEWYPQWHFAVAIGYDLDTREIVLHSGRDARRRTSLSTFEATWERGGSWAVVVLPPERLPARGTERAVVRAAAGLERAARYKEAAVAYETILQRWPDSYIALMGLGNAHYATGNYREAEAAFRGAIARHPERPDPWNNLAHALVMQGLRAKAETAAHNAVRLAKRDPGPYIATLREISSEAQKEFLRLAKEGHASAQYGKTRDTAIEQRDRVARLLSQEQLPTAERNAPLTGVMLSNNKVTETDILGQIGYLGDDISPSGETSRRPQ